MRFTPARLSAIDSFVVDLSRCLPAAYGDACEHASAFMRAHAGRDVGQDEKLFHGDPAHLESLRGGRSGAGAFWAYFPMNATATENLLSDDEAKALRELLSTLPAFVLDGITGYRRKKLIEEMGSKAKRCAKSYGCDDIFSCTPRIVGECRWFKTQGHLSSASVRERLPALVK